MKRITMIEPDLPALCHLEDLLERPGRVTIGGRAWSPTIRSNWRWHIEISITVFLTLLFFAALGIIDVLTALWHWF